MNRGDLVRTLDDVRPTLTGTGLTEYSVSEMSDFDVGLLWERGLSLGHNPEYTAHGKSIFIDPYERRTVVVNELDHIWMITARAGNRLRDCVFEAVAMEDEISCSHPFAANDRDGFLTSWVEQHGTGVRLSIIIFIPAVTLEAREDFSAEVERRGLLFAGPFGIGTMPENPPLGGSLMQIWCHSVNEEGTANNLVMMEDFIRYVTALELECRENLSLGSLDIIARMWGILSNRLTADESDTMASLELGLLGAWNGIIDDFEIPNIQKLFYLCLDGHLMSCYTGRKKIDTDIVRANFVKSCVTGESTSG